MCREVEREEALAVTRRSSCLSGKRAIGEISLPGVGAGLREPTGRQ